MGKPVVVCIICYLRLLRSVGLHPPDLHEPSANGIKVDVPAIVRILWPVIKSLCCSQAALLASIDGNRVDIEIAASLTTVDQGPTVW